MAQTIGTAPGTDLFLHLSPERVLDAVERSGVKTRPVCYPLNSFENRVYEVELEDRTRVVAKFYRPGRWSAEQILEEHEFIEALATAELPVCTLLPFPDGRTLQEIDSIYYCLAERRGGRAPDEVDEPLARRLGRLVGRMHQAGAAAPAPHRAKIDADTFIREPIAFLRHRRSLPRHIEGRYEEAAMQIAELADLKLLGVPLIRTHGDLHLGNLLLRDGELRVLDFDDMAMAPAVQDLWLALPGRDEQALRLREIFIEGYEQFRRFDRSQLALIEILRGLRLVHYAAWLARRQHDPAFQRAWTEFGSDEYWSGQLEDLEDLLRHLDVEPRESAPSRPWYLTEAVDATALTNKDYFWDWEGD